MLPREFFLSVDHSTVWFPLIATTQGVTRYVLLSFVGEVFLSDICNFNSGYQKLEWFCPELVYTRSGKDLYVHKKLFLPSKFSWNIRMAGLGQIRNLFKLL